MAATIVGFILGWKEAFRWEAFWATIERFGQQLCNWVAPREQEEIVSGQDLNTKVGMIL